LKNKYFYNTFRRWTSSRKKPTTRSRNCWATSTKSKDNSNN